MNYHIMHKDEIIALADDNGITHILKKELCPACFAVGMPLEYWLESRCVDVHRSHSRQLFNALRLRTDAKTEQLIEVGHGISITDNWWVQKEDENLSFSDLREYNERIADIALYGSSASTSDITRGYKELGTVGSYEKCWKYIGNAWYMYKQGSTAELISEYYSFQFLKAMNTPVAEYEVHRGITKETGLEYVYMVSKDFTNNAEYDFEPFCNYFSDHEEPEYILPRLDKRFINDYVMMLFYDALLYNGDRHNQNVGFMRDSTSGEIIGLSPYFDYNLALVSAGIPRIDGEKGNLYANSFLENRICCDVLRNHFPDRDRISNAVSYATSACRKVFEISSFNYSLVENYILDACQYISERL